MSHTVREYPLAAIVGQEQLKNALLLCAVNPGIGGVLIRGDKGSAKSTAARGLAAVMAPIERVIGCAYNCIPGQPAEPCEVCRHPQAALEIAPVPFVNLPLGATEDRVLGSLDFERALRDGRKAFQPGLLASAHRGMLYIDEINLLPDHLVDVLLDAAAMNVNRVQREGLSIHHPARVALVGTMNQEEGELRPQLLDRFGMMVEVLAPQEPRVRAEVVRRRLAWEAEPDTFSRAWYPHQSALRDQVLRAQAFLPQVRIADGLLILISELCCALGVTSLRADIVMNKAACAMAALNGRTGVEPDDVAEAAKLVLPHRRRRKPFDQPTLDEDQLEELLRRAKTPPPVTQAPRANKDPPAEDMPAAEEPRNEGDGESSSRAQTTPTDAQDPSEDGAGEVQDRQFAPRALARTARIDLKSAAASSAVGRRSVSLQSRRGRDVRAMPDEHPTDLAVTETLTHSVLRTGGELRVTKADLHQKIRAGRQGNQILFVVDASGSMSALQRMEMVKGTVISLLSDAYQRRDEVGVISFRGKQSELMLPPTRSVDVAERQMRELPTGGRTPLAHALQTAFELLTRASQASRPEPLLIVLSDGKANVPLSDTGDAWQQSLEWAQALAERGIAALVLDTEQGFVRMGRAQALAEALKAQCLSLESFNTQSLLLTIRSRLGRGTRT